MALSNEDHKDVKGALGKAMANKISKVTRDSKSKPAPTSSALRAKAAETSRIAELKKRYDTMGSDYS